MGRLMFVESFATGFAMVRASFSGKGTHVYKVSQFPRKVLWDDVPQSQQHLDIEHIQLCYGGVLL
jgi:hypothetical protein